MKNNNNHLGWFLIIMAWIAVYGIFVAVNVRGNSSNKSRQTRKIPKYSYVKLEDSKPINDNQKAYYEAVYADTIIE